MEELGNAIEEEADEMTTWAYERLSKLFKQAETEHNNADKLIMEIAHGVAQQNKEKLTALQQQVKEHFALIDMLSKTTDDNEYRSIQHQIMETGNALRKVVNP